MGVLEGLPELGPEDCMIILSDPYSFPTDAVLDGIAREAPGVPVLGGLVSARTAEEAGHCSWGRRSGTRARSASA